MDGRLRLQQKTKLDRNCFAHNRLAVHHENAQKGLPNEFDLEDIKGASAAILIAGNDTVLP